MPGDSLHSIEELTSRAAAVGERLARLQALRDRGLKDLESKRQEVLQLTETVEQLSKVEELFKALMDALVVKQVQTVETVISEGLQTIFHDQDLHFESEVSQRYNKVAIDFFIRQGRQDDPLAIRGKPMASFGGGPTSIASFILRLLTLLKLKKYPLLLMDETLSAVSDDYVDATGRFLQTLSQRLGIPILLIIHKPAYLDHADVAYRGQEELNENGTRSLQLRRSK